MFCILVLMHQNMITKNTLFSCEKYKKIEFQSSLYKNFHNCKVVEQDRLSFTNFLLVNTQQRAE